MVGLVLFVLVIANLVLLVPVVVFAVEVFAAATRRSVQASTVPDVRPSAAILVPAHDEEDGIAEIVIALRRQLRPGDRLLVVADNCSDATAARAREAGAEVVERRDASARGKGYALDFGIRHLGKAPPQVVVIVDADCRLDPGSVDRLVALSAATGRPVQGLNLMSVPPGGGLNLQVAELAFLIKNHVRPAGLHRFGLPCHLTGTGMAFPWAIIRDADLAHASLVEDMKLGLDLARRGTPALFCEDARISSHFPYTQEGASSQRRRWEEGHIGMIASGIGQLPAALRSGRADVIAVALDVLVPPLTLLLMLMTAAFAVTAVLTFALSLGHLALIMSGFGLGLFVIAALVAWGVFGRDALPPRSLLRVVPYVLRKLALYPKLAFGSRSGTWVRTDRKRGE